MFKVLNILVKFLKSKWVVRKVFVKALRILLRKYLRNDGAVILLVSGKDFEINPRDKKILVDYSVYFYNLLKDYGDNEFYIIMNVKKSDGVKVVTFSLKGGEV